MHSERKLNNLTKVHSA